MRKYLSLVVLVAMVVVMMQGCSSKSSSSDATGGNTTTPGGSGTTGSAGTMAVALTDAPGDFDHVWITIKDLWIHSSDAADPRPGVSGWHKYPLAAPKTIDLMALTNGNAQSIWDGISLPVGTYQQIRLVLVDTDDPLEISATTANSGATLAFNNEVMVNGIEYPLHIPDARHGIRLVGTFTITAGATLKLAIDFDAGNDIVEFRKGTEYILKPRLNYFDLDHAGAIVGKLATSGTFTAARFVIKAERLTSNGTSTFHIVRRWTVPNPDGSFILYPVSTLVTSTWDVVIRGLEHRTAIIKGVPIASGTTPTSGATDLGTITMTQASTPDYAVDGTITSPTGAWVNFYQKLIGLTEYPYEIRFRHFNPLLGEFRGFKLSSDPLEVATYTTGTLSFTTTTPFQGNGGYNAVADAILYKPSASIPVTSLTTTVAFSSSLTVDTPWTGNAVSGLIAMKTPTMNNKMDQGVLFATHGGMIVHAVQVDSQMVSGGTYSITNLAGGSAGTPLPSAFYGISAIGWSANPILPGGLRHYKAVAIPQVVDLRTGNDTADLTMLPLW